MVLTNSLSSISFGEELKLICLHIGGCQIKTLLGTSIGLLPSYPIGASAQAREIKIEGYVCDNLEENRRKLCQICTLNAPFYLIDGDFRLELIPKYSVEFSHEKRFTDKLLRFTVRASCTSPYWLHKEQLRTTFYNCGGESTDENAIFQSNIGDAPVGFLMEIHMMSSCNLVTLIKGERRLRVVRPFKIMDKLYIDTRHGKKGVYLVESGSSKTVDLMEFVDAGSSFFELDTGENRIDFVVSQGLAYMTLEYCPVYLR